MVHLNLWKGLSKKTSLKLRSEYRKSGEIPPTGMQRIPDRWSDKTEKALTSKSRVTFWDVKKLLAGGSDGA